MSSNKRAVLLGGVAAAFLLPGCATVRSHRASSPPSFQDDGLVYRLPKRGINVSVTFEEGQLPVLTVAEGQSFPDSSGPSYVAKIKRNGVGETDVEINVTEAGLLSTTTSKYTGKIDEFIKALAKGAAASVSTSDEGQDQDNNKSDPCPKKGMANFTPFLGMGGKLNFVGDEAKTTFPIAPGCELTLRVRRAGWPKPEQGDGKNFAVPSKAAGYFYRINMPYVVRAEIATVVKEVVVMLPDESPTYYVELPRAMFASTDNTTTFTNGVLTKHQQKTDSEVIAALKIPADLLGAYSSALGSFFDSFKSTGVKEAQLDTQKVLNEIHQQKLEACIVALREDPTGKTGDTLCAGIQMPSGS